MNGDEAGEMGVVEEEGPGRMGIPGHSASLAEGPYACYSGRTQRDSRMLTGCFPHCTWRQGRYTDKM